MNKKYTVLIVGDVQSIFIYEYIRNILPAEWKVTIANTGAVNRKLPERYKLYYKNKGVEIINCGIVNKKQFHYIRVLYGLLIGPIKTLLIAQKGYDMIHIHFIGWNTRLLYKLKGTGRMLVTVYGSDILRANPKELQRKGRLLKRADIVTIETDEMEKVCVQRFPEQLGYKIGRAGFGSENIEFVWANKNKYTKKECKKINDIPEDKIVAFIGYNGSKAQQHLSVLNELKCLPPDIKDKLYLVFHCSYGMEEAYHEILRQNLKNCGIAGKIDTRYLCDIQLAQLRISADLFLNMQTTDVLSSSMLEFMVGDAIIIQGSWLKYAELEGKVNIEKINQFEELNNSVKKIIENLSAYKKECDKNAEVAYKLLTWESKKSEWENILGMI